MQKTAGSVTKYNHIEGTYISDIYSDKLKLYLSIDKIIVK